MTKNNNVDLDNLPDVLDARTIATILNVGYVKALRIIKSPNFPSVLRIGNIYRVPKKPFSHWLEESGFRKVL